MREGGAIGQALGDREIAYRQQRNSGETATQQAIGLCGDRARINQEQDQRFDRAAPRLFKQPNLIGDGEEIREFPMAQIDDFGNVAGLEETVEKPYLTARIADARYRDMMRQEVRQSGRLIGKIESRHWA